MTALLVDDRWQGFDGIARYSREVISRLDHYLTIDSSIQKLSVAEPLLLSLDAHRKKADVYYSPGFNPPLFFRGRLIFTIHDLMHLRIPGYCTLAKRAYYEIHIRRAVKKAYRVMTVSQYSKEDIARWSGVDPDKIVVAPCGVDPSFRPLEKNPDEHYLLFIGKIRPHKNIPRIFQAFAQARIPSHFRLVLTGTMSTDEAALIAQLGIADRIEYRAFVKDEDLPQLYSSATALLIPSLYEGFGLPALEAMACGTPVIAGNVTSLPEVVGNAGLLVDPTSIDAIANAIESLVLDGELNRKLGKLGLEQSARFCWEQTAMTVKDVLYRALDS